MLFFVNFVVYNVLLTIMARTICNYSPIIGCRKYHLSIASTNAELNDDAPILK